MDHFDVLAEIDENVDVDLGGDDDFGEFFLDVEAEVNVQTKDVGDDTDKDENDSGDKDDKDVEENVEEHNSGDGDDKGNDAGVQLPELTLNQWIPVPRPTWDDKSLPSFSLGLGLMSSSDSDSEHVDPGTPPGFYDIAGEVADAIQFLRNSDDI